MHFYSKKLYQVLNSYTSTLYIQRITIKCPWNMSALPQAFENTAIVLRFLHRLVHYETGTSRAQDSMIYKCRNFYKEFYIYWLFLFRPGWYRKAVESQCTGSSWLLVPEFLNQRAQHFSLNPSFVQGPTMTLLTLLSTSNSLASESPPPSCYPWLDQPTFSPVILTYNSVIHTITAHCTFYALFGKSFCFCF